MSSYSEPTVVQYVGMFGTRKVIKPGSVFQDGLLGTTKTYNEGSCVYDGGLVSGKSGGRSNTTFLTPTGQSPSSTPVSSPVDQYTSGTVPPSMQLQ